MKSEDQNKVAQEAGKGAAEPIDEMLPAYALGVLDDAEQVRVEAELARSATLRQELQRLQATVDTFDLTVPRAVPDRALRDRILLSTRDTVEPVSIVRRRQSMVRGLAAAAAVLVVVLGSALAFLAVEYRERGDRIAQLESATENRSGSDFTQPLIWMEIGAENTTSDSWGYLCRTADGRVAWIIVEGMHASDNRVYQMWLVNDDEMVSAGMFATDEEGRGFGVVRADDPVHSFRQMWITLEPPGGSPEPTSDPDIAVPIV